MKIYCPKPEEHRFIAQWVSNIIGNCTWTEGFYVTAAVIDGNAKIKAAVVYHNYRHPDIEMTIAAASPYWAKKEIIIGLFSYPFYQLGCTRVTGLVDKSNKRARKLDEHIGFKREGAHPQGNGRTILSYGLLKDDFERKWLHGREKHTQSTGTN